MRRLIIDPSSTVLGWVVEDGIKLVAAGDINATRVEYADKFPHIVEELRKVFGWYRGIGEIVTEEPIKYKGRRVPALEVAHRSIKQWAKRIKGVEFYSYYAATWKSQLLGKSNADKFETFLYVNAAYPELDIGRLSEHVIDAIAIGLYHDKKRRLEAEL